MTISLNKYFWTFIISAVSIFVMVFAGHVFATYSSSSTQETATKYGITFPIAELGNCAGLAQCKAYCDDSTHTDACIAFAKKKGFYKETNNNANAYLRSAARTELGCDGPDQCRSFCQLQENHDKCSEFAEKHSLGEGSKPLSATAEGGLSAVQILEKAQEILGCDSISSCKAFCQKTENQQKCSDFAHQVGLAGGIRKPPTTLERHGGYPSSGSGVPTKLSPADFCRQYPDKCRQYGVNPPNFSPSPKPPISPLPPQTTSGFNQ